MPITPVVSGGETLSHDISCRYERVMSRGMSDDMLITFQNWVVEVLPRLFI